MEIDPYQLSTVNSFLPTDTVIVARQGLLYYVSAEVLAARVRPSVIIISADYTLAPGDPGLKIDARGGKVTVTLPSIRLASGNEYAFFNVSDPDLIDPGSFDIVPASGEFILDPRSGKVAKMNSFRPGDTFSLRAEVVPTGNLTLPYDPAGADSRIMWLITRS